MTQTLSEQVSIQMVFDHRVGRAKPQQIFWKNHLYPVTQVGLRHCFRDGRKLFHIFSLISNNLFFRLRFDTENLSWTLEEISDGLPN